MFPAHRRPIALYWLCTVLFVVLLLLLFTFILDLSGFIVLIIFARIPWPPAHQQKSVCATLFMAVH